MVSMDPRNLNNIVLRKCTLFSFCFENTGCVGCVYFSSIDYNSVSDMLYISHKMRGLFTQRKLNCISSSTSDVVAF